MAINLKGMCDALAGLTYAGIRSYRLDNTPNSLASVHLPALIIFLGAEGAGGQPGYQVAAFQGGAGEALFAVTHTLYIEAIGQTRGLRDIMPVAATLIGRYLDAISADPYLGGTIHYAAEVAVGPVLVEEYPRESGQYFYAVDFSHQWRVNA